MNKSTLILLWGIIGSILSIILLYVMNSQVSQLKWIEYVIYFTVLLLATFHYRNKVNGGYITFGEAYKTGILITLIIAVLYTIAFFFYVHTHPDYTDKMLAYAQAQMVNKGVPADQMDKIMNMERIFMSPKVLTIFSLFGGILGGAIISLLTAGICMKKKPFIEPEQESENPTLEI